MARRVVAWWTVVALLLAALALVRITEVFLKREMVERSRVLEQELEQRQAMYRDSLNRHDALRVDLASAQAQASIAPDETYLTLRKSTGRGRVMMGGKIAYEFRFRVRGAAPVQVRGSATDLPEGVLAVQDKQEHPSWFWPDWKFEQAGKPVPRDSSERRISDAFGKYAISLGGGVALHGVADRAIPPDGFDHVYAELSERDLKAVYSAVRPGSRVLIQH